MVHRLARFASWAPALFLVACSSTPAGDSAPEPDMSAIAAFWPLYDTFRAGSQATPEQWNALFATPAYRYLNDVENKAVLYRTAFPAGFAPNGDDGARKLVADKPVFAPFVEHYRRVVANEARLRALQPALSSGPLMSDARELAWRWLPESAQSADWWPAVAFCISAPDGTSYESAIFVDLLAALDMGADGRVRFLAHEMHHAYLQRTYPAPAAKDPRLERVVHALDQLRLEGVADQIDKSLPLRAGGILPAAYAEAYNSAYARSAQVIAQVDALLVRIAREPEQTEVHAEALWESLPIAGHPTGAFMARTILAASGHEALMSALRSPFAFVRAYDEAARASQKGAPGLSQEALAMIGTLERESAPVSPPPTRDGR